MESEHDLLAIDVDGDLSCGEVESLLENSPPATDPVVEEDSTLVQDQEGAASSSLPEDIEMTDVSLPEVVSSGEPSAAERIEVDDPEEEASSKVARDSAHVVHEPEPKPEARKVDFGATDWRVSAGVWKEDDLRQAAEQVRAERRKQVSKKVSAASGSRQQPLNTPPITTPPEEKAPSPARRQPEVEEPPCIVVASSSQKGKRIEVVGGKKVCAVCGTAVTHLKRHMLGTHLPKFYRKNLVEKPSMSYQLLFFIARRLRLRNLRLLLTHVQKFQLYPSCDAAFTHEEKMAVQALADHLSITEGSYSVSPPTCVSALLHWRILMAILAAMTPREQEDVRRFAATTGPKEQEPTRSSSAGGGSGTRKVRFDTRHGGERHSQGPQSKRRMTVDLRQRTGGDIGKEAAIVVTSQTYVNSRHQDNESTRYGRSADRPAGGRDPSSSRDRGQQQLEERRGKSLSRERRQETAPRRRESSPSRERRQRQESASRSERRKEVSGASNQFQGIDTHFHPVLLMRETQTTTLAAALTKLPASANFGISKFVGIFCRPTTWPTAAERVVLRQDSRLMYAYGWHPKRLEEAGGIKNEVNWERLESRLGTRNCVALGEIGLDYTQGSPRRGLQLEALPRLLEIGDRLRKPVVIHCRERDQESREASEDCLRILQNNLRRDHVIHRHCFNGSVGEFRKWRDTFQNCYFGITGIATLVGKCHPQLALVIAEVPEDRLLLETDAPYLTPRGQATNTNSPYLLDIVAKYVAEMRGITLEQVLRITTRNARRCYRLD